MAKAGAKTPVHRCTECGWTTSKWVGRCGECQAWGTVAEVGAPAAGSIAPARHAALARPIGDVTIEAARSRPTGVSELDRALGGGLVQGATLLLAGEPGVGKSTLLLEVAAQWSAARRPGSRALRVVAPGDRAAAAPEAARALYVTGEESAAQVRLRAERTSAIADELYLVAETDLASVLAQIEQVQPSLLILDSVQTVARRDVDGAAGGVTQVREVAGALIRVAKERGMATILVGHVTKEGSIAGPRVLEHLVDVVLHVEGDRHSRLRMVRTVKNRYGPADEVGCFDLTDEGITSMPDPTGLFLSRHAEAVAGTCVTVTLEGRRPLLAEVQALVGPSALASPRRATSGLDSSRLAMVLAVLERRGGLSLSSHDVYSSTVGGARLSEPSADLAVLLAAASSLVGTPLPRGTVAIGEVGLAGELRAVTGIGRRLDEAARLGFTTAIVPSDHGSAPAGMTVHETPDVAAALRVAGAV